MSLKEVLQAISNNYSCAEKVLNETINEGRTEAFIKLTFGNIAVVTNRQ